jgi:hypothetical protein
MTKIEVMGLTIEVEDTGDGFPKVSIDTHGGMYDENYRPTVEIELSGIVVHEMFDEDDHRWSDDDDDDDDDAADEQQRRDEKRGLYAEHEDPAN